MQIGYSFIKSNLIKIPLHTLLREDNKQTWGIRDLAWEYNHKHVFNFTATLQC